jgi:hypothetical protein
MFMSNRYHFVYKTVNKINGNYYIGKHSTMNLDDGYLGSGLLLSQAVKKYGAENFEREIVFFFDEEDHAYEFERTYVAEHLDNSKCYNIVAGGRGWDSASAKRASDFAQAAIALNGRKPVDKEILIEAGKKGSAICKELGIGMFGWSDEDRSKWSSENNENRKWITNGSQDFRIPIETEIPDGFYSGRSIEGHKGRIGMNSWTNGTINIFSSECPGPDFTQGMVKETPTALLPWWQNGTIETRSSECPGPDFIPGRIKRETRIITCPQCGRSGGANVMKRHHFDNCRWGDKNGQEKQTDHVE